MVWSGLKDTEVLAEIGFDSVDSFGAGNGFFFANDNDGEIGGYLSLRREF